MNRIYEPRAYGPLPLQNGYWQTTIDAPDWPSLAGAQKTDVAIIGAGFTGLNAALHLAQAGVHVVVLDAENPGWGASGRNGGFCCLGGGILDTSRIDHAFGAGAGATWHHMEKDAVQHVHQLLQDLDIDADTHSQGETLLAHGPEHWAALQARAAHAERDYGVTPQITRTPADWGMVGPFHGAVTIPVGFGLNPSKYLQGLARAAHDHGAHIFARSPVTRIDKQTKYTLHTPKGTLQADQIIIATNGYSSEDVPRWLSARFMPVQSSVLVTRPLTEAEISAAGWTSDQMAYDSRNLLHYFRLMPNRRFLFGMRGGIFATARSDARIARLIRRDFERMFPAWANVEIDHHWSGLVAMTAKGLPFAGPILDMPGAFASFGYHGNGVAMGSYLGAQLARLMLGDTQAIPHFLQTPPPNIPFGSKRRWLLPPLYTWMALQDR